MGWKAAAAALLVLSYGCAAASSPNSPAATQQSRRPPLRTIAFDNRYGALTTVGVLVEVDAEPAQSVGAACDAMTCRFRLPLSAGMHDIAVIVVTPDGRRSERVPLVLTVP